MTNLIDAFNGGDDRSSPQIPELRLGKEPVMVLTFTAEVETTRLHFESDPAVNSYIVCPGTTCPLCHLGSKPDLFHLLPVLNVESGNVEVLRVPDKRGPGSLGISLYRHLTDPEVANRVLILSRDMNKYRVETRPLASTADRGAAAIAAFVQGCQAGESRLASAFPVMTPEEIAEIPRVRRKLDTIGAITPPKPSAGCGDATLA